MNIDYAKPETAEHVEAYLFALRAQVERFLEELEARGIRRKSPGNDIDLDAVQAQFSDEEQEHLDNFQTEIKRIFHEAETLSPAEMNHSTPHSPRRNLRAI